MHIIFQHPYTCTHTIKCFESLPSPTHSMSATRTVGQPPDKNGGAATSAAFMLREKQDAAFSGTVDVVTALNQGLLSQGFLGGSHPALTRVVWGKAINVGVLAGYIGEEPWNQVYPVVARAIRDLNRAQA